MAKTVTTEFAIGTPGKTRNGFKPARCGRCAACRRSACPSCRARAGLPLGVQRVGPRQGDARPLRTARWLVARVGAD